MYNKIEQYYNDNQSRLVKILTNRAGSVQGAEDVVQDAFERALRFCNSYDENKQPIGAWFRTILNNALKDYKKVERRLGMSVEYAEELEEGFQLPDWEDNMLEVVKKEIESKNVMVRQALYLYFFKQYKPREIEQVLDMTNGYIRTSVKEFKQQMVSKYGDKSEM